MTWRRKWQPTPVFLPGKSHGQRSLAGSIGSQRVRHDWSDLARMHRSVMKVSQTLLQHKLLLHRTQEAGKEQGAQRPEVSGHKLKKAWLQTQAHQCKPCSTTGQKRGSANQMVKTTAQFVVTMKPDDSQITMKQSTSQLYSGWGRAPAPWLWPLQAFPSVGQSPLKEGAHPETSKSTLQIPWENPHGKSCLTWTCREMKDSPKEAQSAIWKRNTHCKLWGKAQVGPGFFQQIRACIHH